MAVLTSAAAVSMRSIRRYKVVEDTPILIPSLHRHGTRLPLPIMALGLARTPLARRPEQVGLHNVQEGPDCLP